MRTTLNVDDDVLLAAKQRAAARQTFDGRLATSAVRGGDAALMVLGAA